MDMMPMRTPLAQVLSLYLTQMSNGQILVRRVFQTRNYLTKSFPPLDSTHHNGSLTTSQIHRLIIISISASAETKAVKFCEASASRSEERRVGKECRSRW